MATCGIVNLKSLKETQNWTSELHLSEAFQSLKGKNPDEIIQIAEELLLSASDFIIEKSLKVLKSTTSDFSSDIINTKHALSSNTHSKLIKSVENRQIQKSERPEELVIAVSIFGILELYSKDSKVQNDAQKEKERLLEALSKIQDFLDETSEKRI